MGNRNNIAKLVLLFSLSNVYIGFDSYPIILGIYGDSSSCTW